MSKLKIKFTNKVKKKNIRSQKELSFRKEKFLFIAKSIKNIIKIKKKVKLISKFPTIMLIGKKQNRIKKHFSIKFVLI
tara:strand:+ start:697 stop:930 length:234 start_codon:yes stop_codon:yes gene_type:complete